MFSLDTRGDPHAAQNGLLLPPTSGPVMESSPFESVLFLRDEMADMVWGVETRVQNSLEASVDRRAEWIAPGKLPPGTPDLPAYHVQTVVADYWIPLVPEQSEKVHSFPRWSLWKWRPMACRRRSNPRVCCCVPPIPGARSGYGFSRKRFRARGAQVDRLYRYARWQEDGRMSMWTARRRRVGRGEGSSGLRFDTLD